MYVWKREEDVGDLRKYRCITLLSHVLNVLEITMDGRIKRIGGVWNGRTKTRFQKRKSYDGCDVQLVKKKTGGTGEYGSGIHRP